MTDLIERTFRRLGGQLPGRVSRPGDDGYAAATSIWPKPVGRTPLAVVHCPNPEDVQSAIRAARDCDLPLSVRGGGHDWAGRALCDGIVIDLSGMNGVVVGPDNRAARISGGARGSDIVAVTDPLGLAPVAGSFGGVGMAGFTLGGGYGALIGRFGLALDNLLAAEVVLADGRVVVANHDNEEELFWALRGGGGNFGVVTTMRHRLHNLPSVRSGMLIYPSSEAKAVLGRCAEIAASTPEDLTVQLGFVAGPDGAPVVLVVATWCGVPGGGRSTGGALSQAWTITRRRYGNATLWGVVDCIRPLYRQWATYLHGDVLASGARQWQHRCFHPGDDACRLARLRRLHPRVQGCRLASARRSDGLRPSPRPRARRDPRHLRRSVGRVRGAATSPVGSSHSSGL